jgi:hypothetical protein
MKKANSTLTAIAVIDRMDSKPRQRQEASLADIQPARAAFSIAIRNTDGYRVRLSML